MKKRLGKTIFILILVITATGLWAQPGGGGGGQGGGGPPPGTGAPVDGGAVGLLVVVAAYAYRQAKERELFKTRRENPE